MFHKAPAATVAELSAAELAGERVLVDRKAGGQPFHHRNESLAV